MAEPLIVIDEAKGDLAARLAAAKPVAASSPKQLRAALLRTKSAICVASRSGAVVRMFVDLDMARTTGHRLLVLAHPSEKERALLNAYFQFVVSPNQDLSLLRTEALVEVMGAPNRSNLCIGGAVFPAAKKVLLWRGNLESVVVPFSWFTARPSGPKPDFADFEVTDSGQTVRLGEYQAAADAVLYEFDPVFRRAEKQRLLKEDRSFGASLRRLRLQRGFSRAGLGVSEKEVARIERGEIGQPHAGTLAVIAKKLGVPADELGSF